MSAAFHCPDGASVFARDAVAEQLLASLGAVLEQDPWPAAVILRGACGAQPEREGGGWVALDFSQPPLDGPELAAVARGACERIAAGMLAAAGASAPRSGTLRAQVDLGVLLTDLHAGLRARGADRRTLPELLAAEVPAGANAWLDGVRFWLAMRQTDGPAMDETSVRRLDQALALLPHARALLDQPERVTRWLSEARATALVQLGRRAEAAAAYRALAEAARAPDEAAVYLELARSVDDGD